jgi:hypothetical protein
MGRLKRDRRIVGLFPSNFVKVLDESFQPGSRNVSPLPPTSGSLTSNTTKATPQKNKSVFRKPFQALKEASSPNPEAAARRIAAQNGGTPPNLTPQNSISKHRPYSSMKRVSDERRNSSPITQGSSGGLSHLRAMSPTPMRNDSYSRAPSRNNSNSRAPSRNNSYRQESSNRDLYPYGPSRNNSYVRTASPLHSPRHDLQMPSPAVQYQEYQESSPPPAPPPHRVAYTASRVPSPAPYNEYAQEDRYHTPEPPIDRRANFTPSPLTTAMNDVMSSLQDMGMASEDGPKTPPNVWSPEAFDQVYAASKTKVRSQTSLGIGEQNDYEEDEGYGGSQDMAMVPAGESRVDNYFQRMESRLRKLQAEELQSNSGTYHQPPEPPPKSDEHPAHPQSSMEDIVPDGRQSVLRRTLNKRKSAYELGQKVLGRTFTTKTNSTETSNTTQSTNHSLMSGASAGAFSATSAGSLARRKWGLGSSRPVSVIGMIQQEPRPETPFTGVTYHSSHASQQTSEYTSDSGLLGGLKEPKAKKSGFFKKMIESAKTSTASVRSTIASGTASRPVSRQKNMLPDGVTAIAGPTPPLSRPASSAAKDMGLSGAVDWVQVRRDVNRSNSLSNNERIERAERCQMMDIPVLSPVDELLESAEGDEGLDGLPITEPTDFAACNLQLVDKSSRFVNSLPPMTTPASLAQGFVCRPYRSDVQRLRAIFTWVSERIAWEDDFEGDVDTRRVIQSRRACCEEIAILVMEMCTAVGIHAEVVRGYLKTPGESLDLDINIVARPNHWWNAVIVEGEWRILDCTLANPSNPKRSRYSSTSSQVAESWWFLTRPMEICYTHVPLLPEQQHIVPPMPHEILLALPCASPPYFKHGLQLTDFDTSLLNLEELEQAHVQFFVPDDVECVAEVEARAFARDADGDFFESGDLIRKRALAQAEWISGRKRYTVKALLPGDEGQGTLKVYAGKRGLLVSLQVVALIHYGMKLMNLFSTQLNPTPILLP